MTGEQGAALVLAHLHGDYHDSTACPWCRSLTARQAYGYGLGWQGAINSVATGSDSEAEAGS